MEAKDVCYINQAPDEFLTGCPVCGASDSLVVHNRGALYNEPTQSMELISNMCKSCSVIYSNPRHSDSVSAVFYKEEQGKLHCNQSIDQLLLQDAKARTNIRLEFVRPYLGDVRKLLEIGGGGLNFAVTAARRHEEIQVDEIDPSFLKDDDVLPNLHLISGFMERSNLHKLRPPYDFIAAFHVLEHQNDPVKFLMFVRELLSYDGYACVEIPYPFSPFWIRKPIDGSFRTVHPLNFTRQSLRYLLKKCGLTPVVEDVSSQTMVQVIAKKGPKCNDPPSVSNSDLNRMIGYLNHWKRYSALCRVRPFTVARVYADVVWRISKGINEL